MAILGRDYPHPFTEADRERIRGELAAAAVERQAEMRAMGLV